MIGSQPELALVPEASFVKACCAALYESEWASWLLGDSFHPGGRALTAHLGQLLGLGPGQRLLDVACGNGHSAIFLAQEFGCQVVGLDHGRRAVKTATGAARSAGVTDLVSFRQGDAEALPFDGGSFDAVLCECAFCTFPDKRAAAAELARAVRPGGRVGLADITRAGPAPPELDGLLAWIACLGDARPVSQYRAFLEEAGLQVTAVERRDEALAQIVRDVRGRLLGAELLLALKKIDRPQVEFSQAKQIARHAAAAVAQGKFGYALLAATKQD